MGMRMFDRLRGHLEQIGDIVAPELVDTKERALKANEFFRSERPDILLVFPFGYTPGMCVLPAIEVIDVPLRLMNSHEDGSYDYQNADTTVYLHHEGPCCIPEYAAGLVSRGRKFKVRTGPFTSDRLWNEVRADCEGAAAARFFALDERGSDRRNVHEHGGYAIRRASVVALNRQPAYPARGRGKRSGLSPSYKRPTGEYVPGISRRV